mgnify:CR=1 FL=1
MPIANENEMIRIIREKAGLSQEEFCEGICSKQALSSIENGKSGVSPITFEKFVARANMNVKPFPCFADERDYDCYMDLHRADFLIDSWQFDSAYIELEKVENSNFSDNRFYYQKWLMLNCRILVLSEKYNNKRVSDLILEALRVTYPEFKQDLPKIKMLSSIEIELLSMLADAYIGMGENALASELIEYLEEYLKKIKISAVALFMHSSCVGYLKEKLYLINNDYETLLDHSNKWYKNAVIHHRSIPIFRFASMNAIALYKTGSINEAITMFKEVLAAGSLINSVFVNKCLDYIKVYTDISLTEFDDIIYKQVNFTPQKIKTRYAARLKAGVYSTLDDKIIKYGGILKLLRNRRGLSASKVYTGLCSKSMYSKVENDKALPSVILAKALLERVGITENLFDFFGNDKEFKFLDLKERSASLSIFDKEKAKSIIEEMKSLDISDDKLVNQEIQLISNIFAPNSKIKTEKFLSIIEETQKDFSFEELGSPLTNTEFTIVQHYIRGLFKTNNEDSIGQGIDICLRLIKYYESLDYDITQYRVNLPMLYMIVAPNLLKKGKIYELENIFLKCKTELMQNHVYIKASIIFYWLMHKYTLHSDPDLVKEIRSNCYGLKLFIKNDMVFQSVKNKVKSIGIQLT